MIDEDFEQELAKVRQALISSIAVEKQLEMEMKKIDDAIRGWESRAKMARENNQEELATQADQRVAQQTKRKNDVTIEQMSQRDFSANLRRDLSRLESRRFTAGSTGAAAALAQTEKSSGAMERLEHKVQAQEIEAKLGSESRDAERKFEQSQQDDSLEEELQRLKASLKKE